MRGGRETHARAGERGIRVAEIGGGQGGRLGLLGVLRRRDFGLLVTGEGVSLVGDQFYFIALPWLVLQLTGDPLTVGGILAVQGVPRAVFMLVGGAVTDRYSPRRVMLVSNAGRLVLVGSLAVLVLAGSVRVWMLYVVAALFGVADGFFFPAQGAIVPQVALRSQLQAANAVLQGLDQVAQFAGPVLAGTLIGSLVRGRAGFEGVGLAFAVDAFSFAVSISMLAAMAVDKVGTGQRAQIGIEAGGPSLLQSLREGMQHLRGDRTLRALLLIVVAVNFLVVGPMLVGIPVLAEARLPEGAQGFGAVMSAFGGGSLLGIGLAGTLPKPPPRITGTLLLALCAGFGVGLAALGFADELVAAILPALLMGLAMGYLVVFFYTWMQARTPQHMMGRMMSLITFASIGLVPVSQALAGVVAVRSITALFVGAAILLLLVLLRAWFVPSLRQMGMQMTAADEPLPAVECASGAQACPPSDERSR
jgi:MFS family permease